MKFIITSESKRHWKTFFNSSLVHSERLWNSLGLEDSKVNNDRLAEFIESTEEGLLQFTQTELEMGKADFKLHYNIVSNDPGFYEPIDVSWVAFSSVALQDVDETSLALRFIHRYNATSGEWFLTVEKLLLVDTANESIFDLALTNKFFNILPDGGIDTNPDLSGLLEMGGAKYDPAYFANVKNDGNPIQANTHIQSVTFAWEEIRQLFEDNLTTSRRRAIRDKNHIKICFCSITSDHTNVANSVTPWPHTLVLYMKFENTILLSPSNIALTTSFRNRGANYDTLCPPYTMQYIWPPQLGW